MGGAGSLVSRLRGLYAVGEEGEYGSRDFSSFIPPISYEAADRIEELQEQLCDMKNAALKLNEMVEEASRLVPTRDFSKLSWVGEDSSGVFSLNLSLLDDK